MHKVPSAAPWLRVLAPRRLGASAVAFCLLALITTSCASIPNFQPSRSFDEQIRVQMIDDVRILIDAAGNFDAKKPTLLIVYALPNGNSIEQTVGAREAKGRDWHFNIQHIGAQTRLLRQITPEQNIVVAYVEATTEGIGKSWPAWRAKRPDNPATIRSIVDTIAKQIPGKARIALVAHSGGGSFITGYLNSADAIDDRISRIVYLDANYSYDDTAHHGDKLLEWLRADRSHQLVVICYDDRNITLNGKPVVSATGGTWRATYRMMERFKKDVELDQSLFGDSFDTFWGMNGRVRFYLHRNPNNEILHTRLVGEMNGFIAAMTMGTPQEVGWGTFGGPVAYDKWIAADPISLPATTQPSTRPATGPASQPATTQASSQPTSQPTTAPATQSATDLNLPPRAADAPTGSEFMQQIAPLSRDDREAAILEHVRKGNVPSFLRTFKTIEVKFTGKDGVTHVAQYKVAPDYLAIGSDADFVRMPMLPATAQKIADLLDCSLPTRKMVDDIDAHATVRLDPIPMTEQRESPLTFLEHQRLIECQRSEQGGVATSVTGPAGLICGIKKDIVITNRLKEKPHRVAIYGWRKLDGTPIQPLTIVHVDTYVDYSHGVRLIENRMLVDGRPSSVDEVLKDQNLCGLLSDEGVIQEPRYR